MLDDTDVSFEDDAAIAELNRMGFVIMQGGIGRRLQGSAAAAGFFNMLEGAEEGGFSCGSIEPPQLPSNYKTNLITYELCDQVVPDSQQGDGKFLNCQSDFGGHRPGVMGMPENLFRLTLPDTRRGDKLTAVDITDLNLMENSHRLAWRTEEVVIDSPSYSLTASDPPHHFGQKQVSLQDKASTVTYSFQVADPLAEFFTPGRKYCSEATPGDQGNDDAFLEYRGLWVEGDKSYRHWRLMKKTDAEIAFGGTLDPSDVASFMKETSYEYFDDPETLTPFRLISPSGMFVEYHNYQVATDETVTEYLSKLDLTLEDAMAPECELRAPEDAEYDDEQTSPRMFRSLELEKADGTIYKSKLAGLARDSKLNTASFGSYVQRVLDPFSAPDYCLKACGIGPERVSRVDGTCALNQEDATCLLSGSGFYTCQYANLAQTALPCTTVADSEGPDRRLHGGHSCSIWFSKSIGRFSVSLCYGGHDYKVSASGSGCGLIYGVNVCTGGTLEVAYNNRVDGSVFISADVSVPGLASAELRATILFYSGTIRLQVTGTVIVGVSYVGALKATLRGVWNGRSIVVTAEVDTKYGWGSYSRYKTYTLT
jgi:hypothetical protein